MLFVEVICLFGCVGLFFLMVLCGLVLIVDFFVELICEIYKIGVCLLLIIVVGGVFVGLVLIL